MDKVRVIQSQGTVAPELKMLFGACMCVDVWMCYVCAFVCVCLSVCVYVNVCLCVYVYVYVYVFMYVCVYMCNVYLCVEINFCYI